MVHFYMSLVDAILDSILTMSSRKEKGKQLEKTPLDLDELRKVWDITVDGDIVTVHTCLGDKTLELVDGYAHKLNGNHISWCTFAEHYAGYEPIMRHDPMNPRVNGELRARSHQGFRILKYYHPHPGMLFTLYMKDEWLPMKVVRVMQTLQPRELYPGMRLEAIPISPTTLQSVPPSSDTMHIPVDFKLAIAPHADPMHCWIVANSKHPHRNAIIAWGEVLQGKTADIDMREAHVS